MIRAWPLCLILASAAGAEPLRPAELPPPDYAGLQYVDSKGCLFARAGNGGEVLWIPRVTREGVPVCGNQPSGQRVPVVEEVGVQPVPEASGRVNKAETETQTEATGGFFVEVGSFAEAETADRAEALLAKLDYPAVRGRVQGSSGLLITLFAGPFTEKAAAAAQQALRDEGFTEAALIRP